VFVHDVVGNENNPVYQTLAAENLDRQYAFLKSVVVASLNLGRPLLSLEVLHALNYHAISCLHAYAGQLRPCPVVVGQRTPPDHVRVPALMSMFVDEVNRFWESNDAVFLATYVLWRVNYIHPFVNGNGRTARAACYFTLCIKAGGLLPGEPILPELIRANRPAYVAALQHAHKTFEAGAVDLKLLHALISQLANEQERSAITAAAAQPDAASNDATVAPATSTPSTPATPDASGLQP
jgi:Fic family protein